MLFAPISLFTSLRTVVTTSTGLAACRRLVWSYRDLLNWIKIIVRPLQGRYTSCQVCLNLCHLNFHWADIQHPSVLYGEWLEQNWYTALHKHSPGKCSFPVKTTVDWGGTEGKIPQTQWNLTTHGFQTLGRHSGNKYWFYFMQNELYVLAAKFLFWYFPVGFEPYVSVQYGKGAIKLRRETVLCPCQHSPQRRHGREGSQGTHRLGALLHPTLQPRARFGVQVAEACLGAAWRICRVAIQMRCCPSLVWIVCTTASPTHLYLFFFYPLKIRQHELLRNLSVK